MYAHFGEEVTVHFPDGSTATVKALEEYAENAADNQFFLELRYPANEPLCRVCLEDEFRHWYTFLYSDGPWLVDRGESWSWQQGTAIPQPGDDNTMIVTTSAITLVTSDDNEWLWQEDGKAGVTVYFTKPLGGGGDFILDEQVPSTDAFPIRFEMTSDLAEGEGGDSRDIRRKKVIIIWK